MIFSYFRDVEVAAYLETAGYPYQVGSDQNDIILRSLERFTEETMCLFDDNITLTTSATDTFALRTTASFAKKVFKIQDVWLEGDKIQRIASQQDASRTSNYHNNTAGTPAYWWTQGQSLVFEKDCSGVLTNSFVSGWFLHSSIGDTEDLEIPDTDIDYAAKRAAIDIMEKRAVGEVREWMYKLKGESDKEMAIVKARATDTTIEFPTRRLPRRIHTLS